MNSHPIRIVTTVWVALLVALLTSAGCGGAGGDIRGTTPPTTPTTPPPPSNPPPDPPGHAERLPFPFETWRGTTFEDTTGQQWLVSALVQQHHDISRVPFQPTTDARQMPIYHDEWPRIVRDAVPRRVLDGTAGKRFFVGVDQGTQYIEALQSAGSRNDIDVRHGQVADGAGFESVEAYLADTRGHLASYPDVLTRFRARPQVWFADNATRADVNRLVHAVQIVNTALPPEWKMEFASAAAIPVNPNSGIYVRFPPEGEYDGGPGTAGYATPNYIHEFGPFGSIKLVHYSATVTVKRDYADTDARTGVITLAHELIHALGMLDHVDEPTASIMGVGDTEAHEQRHCPVRECADPATIEHPLSLLYPVDREALQVLYRRLASDASFDDFGPWTATSTHLHGNGAHTGFGVALRNGYAEPWAYGYLPEGDLADNAALDGTVTWNGTLLGFTAERQPLAGDTRISVDLDTLAGRVDFTGLEFWAAGTAPGAAGTGGLWGDGDLGYLIAVRDNTFKQAGGDEGWLTGIFTGANHEGAAGTLERQDMTAAFGASR